MTLRECAEAEEPTKRPPEWRITAGATTAGEILKTAIERRDRPITTPTRERDIQRTCEAILAQKGIEYLHMSHRAREKKGWPDLTFAVRGQPCAVEIKTETGTVSVEQEAILARLKWNGWHTKVIRSTTKFHEFVTELELNAEYRDRDGGDHA